MVKPPIIGMERHVQTIIQVVLVALILWSGQSTLEIKDKVARLEEQIRALSKDVATSSNDRYTGAQAARDNEAIHRRFATLEKEQETQNEWVRSLRDRIISLEQDFRAANINRRQPSPANR